MDAYIFVLFILVIFFAGIIKTVWFHEALRAKKKWKKIAEKYGWKFICSNNFQLKYSPFKMELTYKEIPVVVEWLPLDLGSNSIQALLWTSSNRMEDKFTKFSTTNSFKGEVVIKKKYGIHLLKSYLPEYFGSLREATSGFEEYDRKFKIYSSSPELSKTLLTSQLTRAHLKVPYSSVFLSNGELTLLCNDILMNESKILNMLDLLSEFNNSIA